MLYKDIPTQIQKFVSTPPSVFNVLDEDARRDLYEAALRRYDKARQASELSLYMRSEYEYDNDNNNVDDIRDQYREFVYTSNMGVETIEYTLKDTSRQPSISSILHYIQHLVRIKHPTNITFTFINPNDVYYHISFSRKDLKRYSLEQLMSMLTHPVDEWFPDLYTGSDYVYDLIKHYTFCRTRFALVISHISGGYGKMLPDYYATLGLEDNGDNCLIRCMTYFTGKPYLSTSIKEEENRMLSVNDIESLERYFGIHVDVYRDQRILEFEHKRVKGPNVNYIESYKSIVVKDEDVLIYGSGQSKYKILFKDNHYDVIVKRYAVKDCHCPYTGQFIGYGHRSTKREIVLRIKEQFLHDMENLSSTSSEDIPDTYFFFDYETVFDPTTMEIVPYAASICSCDSDGNITDIQFFVGRNDVDRLFIEYLKKHASTKQYLIGYNNSRFDNYILMKAMMRHDMYIHHVRFAGTSILSIHGGGYIVRDLCRFLNTSLSKACQSFGIEEGKKVLRHEDYQFAYLNGKLDELCASTYNELRDYTTRDVTCLSKLFFCTKTSIERLTGFSIENHYTLAGLSFKAFMNTLPDGPSHLPVLKKEYKPFDEFVRKAILGGRSQIEEAEAHNIVAIDCVSLYPYVMLNREYPIGYPKTTHDYRENKIGVYKVTIGSQASLKYNIIPLRGQPHRWKDKDKMTTVISSVDINCLRRHGCTVDIHYGIYWESSIHSLFDAYFKGIMKEKQHQDQLKEQSKHNPVIREICKLLLNSLSGKLVERIHNTIRTLCFNAGDIDRFLSITIKDSQRFVPFYNSYIGEGNIDGKPKVPSIFGVLIYAYARTHMYDSIISQVSRLYGTDTDSAFISSKDFEQLDPCLMGNDFGQFKVEHSSVSGIFVAPKCYCFYKDHNIIKARFKGINLDKDKLVDEDATRKSPLELYSLYHELPPIDVLHIYRKIIKERVIYVLSNNISKRIVTVNESLYLHNHTYVKTIRLNENELIQE